MAQLIAAFNALDFDPSQGGGSMPVGKHPVVISDSEVKATQKNDGGYLELTLSIIDGPQKGTTGAYRLNLYNATPKAVEIAQRQMSALCHAINVFQITDTRAMHNIPFIVEVGLQKGEDAAAKGYTEVKKVFDINGNEPGKAPAAGQQQQPQNGFAQQQPNGFAQQQQQAPQQQQQAAPAAGGWGQQQPQQQPQPQQQQAPQQQQGAAWGGGQPQQQQQATQQGGTAWGGGQQPQQQAQQQQQPAAGGWAQAGQGGGGSAPWGK